MSTAPELRHAVVTDVGLVRSNNEDAYLVAPPLFAVADGMGGHRAGEVASAEAIETLAAQAGHDTDSLVAAVHAANEAVFARASDNPALAGMGTTVTAMLSTGGSVQIVHVGDSRAYLLRDGRLRRLTQDHTVVDRLAREGKISPADVDHHPQRSVLERALGVGPEVDVDVQLIDIHPADRLLLCTDGLTSMLEDEDIRSVLLNQREPQAAAQRLVDEALQAGGKDNVTALVVDVPRSGGSDADRTAEQPAVPPEPGPLHPGGGRPARGAPGSPTALTSRFDAPAGGAGMTSLGLPLQRPSGPTGANGTPTAPSATTPGSTPGSSPGASPTSAPGRTAGATPTPGRTHGHFPARHSAGSATGRATGSASAAPPLPESTPDPLVAYPRRPPGVRLLIVTAVVVPLLVIGLLGGWFAVHNAWYVGESEGSVAVFRGVPGSFAGLKISSLTYKTTLTVTSLPQVYQTQVRQGVTASGKANALHIVDNYRAYAAQAATPSPAPAVTGTSGASP